MAVENAARTLGAEWKAIVGKSGPKESAAAFASNAVLETSVMNGRRRWRHVKLSHVYKRNSRGTQDLP
jgi:hypothetical protein